MYCPKQQNLFHYPKFPSAHGGSLNQGKRKKARPLCAKRPIHIVMRAEQARGPLSLLLPKRARLISQLLKRYSAQFEVRVYQWSNVSNHLHLLVKTKTKAGLRNFLRVFAGQIAQKITGAAPQHPLAKRFWDFLAYTRLIEWGRAFKTAKNYLYKNILQATALRPFNPLRV